MINKKWNTSLTVLLCSIFLMSTCIFYTVSVKSEMVKTTILEEGFEDWAEEKYVPSSKWDSNTGWLDSHYGDAHNGSGWAYSWAAGDNLTTIPLTFGNDTEISFWYAAENEGNDMHLEVYIDGTKIWDDVSFSHTTYQQVIIDDLSVYNNGEHTISFVGQTSDTQGQLLDDVKIISYFDEEDIPSDDDDDDTTPPPSGDDDDDSSSPGTPPPDNNPPVADLSNGEPYQGYTNSSIMFDGTKSYDPDSGDDITKWVWNFGDDSAKESGEIVYHSFEHAGNYTVTLTVLDSNGANASDTTMVTVLRGDIANETENPPGKPTIRKQGSFTIEDILIVENQSESASFTISAADNETVSFTIDWDDGNQETISEFEDGIVNITHSWDANGRYDVSVVAKNANNTASEVAHLIVLMNLEVETIAGDISGYLYSARDEDDYSYFYNSDFNIETEVEIDEKNQYLIDSDADDEWDYIYNMTTGLSAFKSDANSGNNNAGDETPGFELILIALSLCLFFVIRRKRR